MQVILGQLDYRILQCDNHSTRASKSGSELAFKPQGLMELAFDTFKCL
jgi:hypothetical protein